MIEHDLIRNMTSNCLRLEKIGGIDDGLIRNLNALYLNEPLPIFEQNHYHILSSLQFNNRIYLIEDEKFKGVLVLPIRNGRITFFTPLFYDGMSFDHLKLVFSKDDRVKELYLQNVSEDWLRKNSNLIENNMEIIPRSKEEVVYDTSVLVSLSGKKFAKLRQTRNRLINSGRLIFEQVTEDNLDGAINIVEGWNKYQGFKYDKDKMEKEKHVVEVMTRISKTDDNLRVEMAKYGNSYLGLIIYFGSIFRQNWGEIYMVKGLNRKSEGGVRGVSDACYLHIFEEFRKMKVEYINDGELGYEKGTREHKMRFQPVMFLKS